MKASCHCGAVVREVTLLDGVGTARPCDCSFCRRRAVPAVVALKQDLVIIEGVNPADHEPISWTDSINHPSDQNT